MVRHRENPVASLCLQWNSRFFKEFHYILGRERIESTVQEFRVRHNCPEQFFRVTVICNIASAFSCNIHFLSKFLIFLQNVDLMSCPCQINTGHHSSSSAAYDQYFTHLDTFHKSVRKPFSAEFPGCDQPPLAIFAHCRIFFSYRIQTVLCIFFKKTRAKPSLHVSFVVISIGSAYNLSHRNPYSSLIKPDMLRFWYQQPSHPPFSPEPDDT